jgi:hypothetical protein
VRHANAIGKILGFIGKQPFDAGRQLHERSLCFDDAHPHCDQINNRPPLCKRFRQPIAGIFSIAMRPRICGHDRHGKY